MNNYLSAQGWYGYNFHEIQPLMINSPDETQSDDHIQDKNLRLTADYHHFTQNGDFHSSLTYIRDYELFNDQDRIEVKHAEGSADYAWNMNENTMFNIGVKSQYIVPVVHAYANGAEEFRQDIYASFKKTIVPGLLATINARKSFVPQLNPPIAPSLSLEYTFNFTASLLKLRAIGDKSYRIPTFNERYWRDQGRKDLKPEEGFNYECGANYALSNGPQKLEIDLSIYYMLIDDWIAWQPTTFLSDRNGDGFAEQVYDWRPFNLKKVSARGLELSANYTTSFGNLDLNLRSQYALNKTTLLEGMTENDPSIGHQLPYTPLHRFSAFATLIKNNSSLNITGIYVGRRTGTDIINDQLDAYMAINGTISHQLHFKNQLIVISGSVKNIFNIKYQNIKSQAMPGTNYLVSVQYHF